MKASGASSTLVVALMSVVLACSAGSPPASAPPGTSAPSASISSPTPASPTASSPGSATSPTPPGEPPSRQPLVLAVHATHGSLDLRPSMARALLAGELDRWPGGPGRGPLRVVAGPVRWVQGADLASSSRAALAAVQRGRADLAVVPAAAVGPDVSVVSVDGVDPMRTPRRYPFRVAGPRPDQVVTVSVVGDVMLGRSVGASMAAAGDFAAPLRPTARRLAGADLTVGNMENTLSQAGPPRQPGDDSFGADPRAVVGLQRAGFDVISLANNHTGDYGPRALVQTVRRARAAGLQTVGAGRDAAAARRAVVVSRGGVRFGFLAFNAIGETPRAGRARPGVVSLRMNPRTGPLSRADLGAMTRAVRRLDARVDVTAVLPHWGEQYTTTPDPDQRLVAGALADAGADLVLGSHPHWVQGVGMPGGAFLIHSLGNFVFDMDFSRETREGLILELTFWGAELKGAQLVPVLIGADFAPRVVAGPARAAVLNDVWRSSGPRFRPPAS